MDTTMTKDARGLVDGVMTYLRHEGRSKSVMPKVQAFLTKVTTKAKQEKAATLESSVELTDDEKKRIEAILVRVLGHDITMECVVNPQIIAGFRIQVGDWVVDTTLKSQLEQMATILNQ